MDISNKKTGDTIFHNIVTKGLEETRKFCESGSFSVNLLEVSNNLKQRPIHIAVAAQNISLVEYLLKKGANVDAFKKGDWTSLMIASTLQGQKATHIVKLLIFKGANIKLKNKDGWTSMHLACKYGNIETIKILANAEPSLLEEPSRNGRLPMHIAALNSHADVVSLLIKLCGQDICNKHDACGSTPSMDAVIAGSIEVLQIISSHANIMSQRDKFGLSCLHKAVQMGHLEIVNFLIQMGFDVNEKSGFEENTPLHYAAMEKHQDVIVKLLSVGADTKLFNKYNQTVLDLTRGLEASILRDLIEKTRSERFL